MGVLLGGYLLMVYLYLTSSTLYFCQTLLLCTINLLNSVTTHLRESKKVRIHSQLRVSDLPVGDASRTLPSSSGLLELLPIYRSRSTILGVKELVNTPPSSVC